MADARVNRTKKVKENGKFLNCRLKVAGNSMEFWSKSNSKQICKMSGRPTPKKFKDIFFWFVSGSLLTLGRKFRGFNSVFETAPYLR
jgi:hypothetical protein